MVVLVDVPAVLVKYVVDVPSTTSGVLVYTVLVPVVVVNITATVSVTWYDVVEVVVANETVVDASLYLVVV